MVDIYKFSRKHQSWIGPVSKDVLGGKGAGLVQMCKDGLNVPPGFTITTYVCKELAEYAANANLGQKHTDKCYADLMVNVAQNDAWLGEQFGFPPLVSVRSGAPISMPGMMDTILNVGLTTSNVDEWGTKIGERAAFDSCRRLIQMLGATAFDVPMEVFDKELAEMKKQEGVTADTDLDVAALKTLCFMYTQKFKAVTQTEFPNTREAQMEAAIKAVFNSWMNPRAIEYRKINKIDGAMGTACTVQAMVFGNMGEDSGTGVLFSRDPSTGEPGMMGEFLTNAQGEDVVAGIRTPMNVWKMNECGPAWCETQNQLVALCQKLEASYTDMVDIEFTVQQGTLFVLQSRSGKRSARAAFRIAVDQVNEALIDKKTAYTRLSVEQFKTVRRPSIDPKFKVAPNFTGLPACPGVSTGKPVFSSEDAVASTEPCILVTHETNPNDIAGMARAAGILTQTGGATSHAAVVARAMDKTCVVGCTTLDWDALHDAKSVTLDGSTGRVWLNVEVPVIDSSDAPEVKQVMDWCIRELVTCQTTPVDLGHTGHQRIMAALWWGNEEVMDAVLTGIAKLPDRSNIVLDLRKLEAFVPTCDAALEDCFGGTKDDGFSLVLKKALRKRAKALKGLGLAFYPGSEMELEAWSSHWDGKVDKEELPFLKNVPLDYAAFAILGQ